MKETVGERLKKYAETLRTLGHIVIVIEVILEIVALIVLCSMPSWVVDSGLKAVIIILVIFIDFFIVWATVYLFNRKIDMIYAYGLLSEDIHSINMTLKNMSDKQESPQEDSFVLPDL